MLRRSVIWHNNILYTHYYYILYIISSQAYLINVLFDNSTNLLYYLHNNEKNAFKGECLQRIKQSTKTHLAKELRRRLKSFPLAICQEFKLRYFTRLYDDFIGTSFAERKYFLYDMIVLHYKNKNANVSTTDCYATLMIVYK